MLHADARKKFCAYKKEKQKASVLPKVQKTPILERMIEEFEKYDFKSSAIRVEHSSGRIFLVDYNCGDAAKGPVQNNELLEQITSDDVENFSLILAGLRFTYDHEKEVSTFFYHLMNNCRDNSFMIHTAGFLRRPSLIVPKGKSLVIKGDVLDVTTEEGASAEVFGNACGLAYNSMGVKITVHGSVIAGSDIGKHMGIHMGKRMRGTEIQIHGNVSNNHVGLVMSGGSITVHGNSSNCRIGAGMCRGTIRLLGPTGRIGGSKSRGAQVLERSPMTGGEIYIEDSFKGLGLIEGGRIYHKGKLIVDK